MSGMQLATSHETLATKNTCQMFPQVLQFVEGVSKQLYQGLLVSFIEVGHFRCFDVSIIMRDKVREYGLEGNIWVKGNMRILNLDYICKKFKPHYILLKEHDLITILGEGLRLYQLIIWKIVFDIVHHIEGKK